MLSQNVTQEAAHLTPASLKEARGKAQGYCLLTVKADCEKASVLRYTHSRSKWMPWLLMTPYAQLSVFVQITKPFQQRFFQIWPA